MNVPAADRHRASRSARAYLRVALHASLRCGCFRCLASRSRRCARPTTSAAAIIWGWPSDIAFDNYAAVFADTRMLRFILNSVVITMPSVVGAVTLACMAGFALAKIPVPRQSAAVRMFIAGNLVPLADPDDPGARSRRSTCCTSTTPIAR